MAHDPRDGSLQISVYESRRPQGLCCRQKLGNVNTALLRSRHFNLFPQDYASADEEELRRWRPVLEGLAYVATRTFYKVPFTEALELVRTRKVLVSNGYCFVPDTDMTSLVAAVFRAMLTQALAFTSKMLPQLNEDERMVQVSGKS